jgi:alkanesulfonate monooxygenase SsuD/methylene tetrahydromethanopterin reductase-like flavin-dependent oxidoreductase (luciferase family)
MQFGIHIPPFGPFADIAALADLAQKAEAAGWDGFFLWDDVAFNPAVDMADPWIALAAIALRTENMRLGPLVTPLPRRRPWKVAREAVSLDHLSHGRLILGVGSGGAPEEFANLGEAADPKVRAAQLDEGLDILAGLWRGEPFEYTGAQYTIRAMPFLPRPVQSPRIPVWVGGSWPLRAPMRRAARWDGVYPLGQHLSMVEMLSPEEMAAVVAYVTDQRQQAGLAGEPFAVAHYGISSGDDRSGDAQMVATYQEAGVTWWLENVIPERWGSWSEWPVEAMTRRIEQGPPGRL